MKPSPWTTCCCASCRELPGAGQGHACAAPALPSASNPAAYKPQTQYDNTPWRFNMSQNGKRMTAEEFDAWMKARGVRVAKGAKAAPGRSLLPQRRRRQSRPSSPNRTK